MNRNCHAPRLDCVVVLLAIAVGACAQVQIRSATPSVEASLAAGTPSTAITPSAVGRRATTTPLALPSATSTGVAAPVVVTAAKGNLFIRRGPDFAFNPIGALLQGQSATALARDVLAEWLQIPLPGQSSQSGWISIQSQFTVVDGDVMTLPEIQPDYWPVAASVRNCTLHEMQLIPGSITLPSVVNFPYNDVQVNPGTYTVIDTDIDSYPSVAKVEVREGSSIDIVIDGNGDKKKCPVP